MSKSKFVDFKAIKAAITMEQVLEHYGLIEKFKRNGDSLSGPCPIHKGNNPTQFRVSISKNVWNCFSECKHGGNVLDFIARMDNVSIHAAAMKAIEWFNLDEETMSANSDEESEEQPATPTKRSASKPKPAPKPESTTPNKPLKFRLDKLDREHLYLKERGLTQETIVDFGIGFCAKGVMADRIAIPIHNPNGEVVAYAGRFPGEPAEDTPKYKLPQGFRKSLELFNIDRAVKESSETPWVIVEGFFDCMWLHQHACRKAVALMGSSMSTAQEDLLRQHIGPTDQIILMLDEDEAGCAACEDIAVRLCQFAYVRIHAFGKEGMQPEQLTAEEIVQITGGLR